MGNPSKDDPPSPPVRLGQSPSAVSLTTNTVPVEPFFDDADNSNGGLGYDVSDSDLDSSPSHRLLTPHTTGGSSSLALHHPHHPHHSYPHHHHSLDADDPPPLYTDDPTAPAPALLNPLVPRGGGLDLGLDLKPLADDRTTGNQSFLDGRLDRDPALLEQAVRALAALPPRPHCRLRGTHSETTRKRGSSGGGGSDRTETRRVVDFDVLVDLTPFLYRDVDSLSAWRTLRTASPFDKVRRGTVFRTRAPGFGGSGPGEHGGSPTLREWCHRFCASHWRLRTFLVRRRVVGLDEDLLRAKLEALVRATQYRGRLDVSFPVRNETVDIYSDAWENRCRLRTWLWWVLALTGLVVLWLPYLFFQTVRFEVVTVDWAFSRPRDPSASAVATSASASASASPSASPPQGGGDPRHGAHPSSLSRDFVSVSEEQWYNLWGRAIQKAVLDRRQATLDQADLRDADGGGGGMSFADLPGGGARAMESLRLVGVHAMNAVNRQFGWGYDC